MRLSFIPLSLLFCLCGPVLARGSDQLLSSNGHQAAAGFSNIQNPAYGVSMAKKLRGKSLVHVVGAGSLEYGNVDDLFQLIDDLSKSISGPDGGGGNGGGNGGEGGGKPIEPPVDIIDPEFEELLRAIGDELATIGALLGWVAAEGYAKAELDTALYYFHGREALGGFWQFGAARRGVAGAIGLADPVEFDEQQALAELERAWNLTPDSPKTTFDLSGGLELTVDPQTGKVSIRFRNDSVLLTKYAEETAYTLDYSATLWEQNQQRLDLGIRPKILRLGMSNTATRLGDIRDSESLFQSIDDAKLYYETEAALDVGLAWHYKSISLGAFARDINSPSFTFPKQNYDRYTKSEIIEQIERARHFEKDPQFQLDATLNTGRWLVNVNADINAVYDPIQLRQQLIGANASYSGKHWFDSNIRVGIQKNRVGSELSFVSVGYTLFHIWDIDLATTLETVKLQGDEFLRGAAISTGLRFRF